MSKEVSSAIAMTPRRRRQCVSAHTTILRPEAQCFLAFRLRIVMDLRIGPAIARVRLICIIDDQPSIMEQSEALRAFPVVLVCLRRTVREVELAMIQAVS